MVAAALQAIGDPKATNLGALALMSGFALLISLGLHLRSRSNMIGHWMVMIGMSPALLFFWFVIPAVVGVAVIAGAAWELSQRA